MKRNSLMRQLVAAVAATVALAWVAAPAGAGGATRGASRTRAGAAGDEGAPGWPPPTVVRTFPGTVMDPMLDRPTVVQ